MSQPISQTSSRVWGDGSTVASIDLGQPSSCESLATLLPPDLPNDKDHEDEGSEAPRPRHWGAKMEAGIEHLRVALLKKTWGMYSFLVAGTLFAIGHHIFYSCLDGKEARKHQSLMLRYGTILAFCTKASLGAAVIAARRQRVWMVVRKRVVRLGTVDSIFTAAEDITALLDWRAVKKAKVATCLAVYIWVAPLVVVLTSETLSVIPGIYKEDTLCPEARTLNFAHEDTQEWRAGVKVNGINVNSLSFWNKTSDHYDPKDPSGFDYYTSASFLAQTWVEAAVHLQAAAGRHNASTEICGSEWDCSYQVEFVAPGYKCEQLAHGKGSKVEKLGDAESPFGIDQIIPEGNYSYLALTDRGEYAEQQIDNVSGGKPIQPPPFPPHLGALRTEPVIWIGYATVDDPLRLQPQNKSMEGWDDAYTPVIFGCEHWEVKYDVVINYTNGIQGYKIRHREYLQKIINTTFVPGQPSNDGTWDNTTAVPESNYVLPQDLHRYRRVAAYHSLGATFRSFLNGSIVMDKIVIKSDFLKTRLFTLPNFLADADLRPRIQKMYEDIVMSLLSNPAFVVVSWANNASQFSGSGVGGGKTRYECVRSRSTTFFKYNKSQLCIVYSLSIAMALVGVLLGVQAARQEGVMRDVKPSSIIEAARARSLTEVQTRSDQDIKSLKVGFGWVEEHSGENVRGFGLAGDVAQEHPELSWRFWRARPRGDDLSKA